MNYVIIFLYRHTERTQTYHILLISVIFYYANIYIHFNFNLKSLKNYQDFNNNSHIESISSQQLYGYVYNIKTTTKKQKTN